MEPPQRPRQDHRTAAPLYEERFEHDACGVGFVADAGGHSRDRVLPLALAGLAALGHRGAFGADGKLSDGAGVALPLDRSILDLIAGDALAAERPAVVSLFLPRGRAAERQARALVEATFAEADLPVAAWRAVPVDVAALGARPPRRVLPSRRRWSHDPRARRRPAPHLGRRLRASAGRRPTAAGDGRPRGRWCGGRPVRAVRLGANDRVQGPRHRQPPARPVPGPARAVDGRVHGLPSAVRHEHPPRLAARPAVPVDRPQRRDQHGPR